MKEGWNEEMQVFTQTGTTTERYLVGGILINKDQWVWPQMVETPTFGGSQVEG